MTCHHFPYDELAGCTFCSGKETGRIPPKAIKVAGPPKKRVPTDPALVLAEQVALGLICEHCLTAIAPIGCDCSRKSFYHEQLGKGGVVREWLHANTDAFLPAGATDEARAIRSAEKVVTGLAFSTMTRASRRAGLARDDVLDDDGKLAGCSALGDQRLEILAEFNVDPTWHAARTQEADPLPV